MILLSHDENTIPPIAWRMIAAGISIPGVVIVPQDLAIASVLDDLELIALAGRPGDFREQVRYLPLR